MGFDANTAKTDAQTAVSNAKDADKGGSDKAYASLVNDVQKEWTKNPSLTQDEKNTYLKAVGDEAQKQGLLPELTLEWAQTNHSQLSDASGKLTKTSLDKQLNSCTDITTSSGNCNTSNPLEQAFAANLKSQFDSISHADHTNSRNVSMDDLKKAQTKERSDAFNRQALAPLYAGNPPLIQVLDTGRGGTSDSADGHISTDDLHAYLNSAPSGANRDFVQNLLDGKITVKDDQGNDKIAPKDFHTSDMAKYCGFSDVDISGAKDKNKVYSEQVGRFNTAKQDQAGLGIDTTITPVDQQGDKTLLDGLDPVKHPDAYQQYVSKDANGNPVIAASQINSLEADPTLGPIVTRLVQTSSDGSGGIDLNKVSTEAMRSQGDLTDYSFNQYLASNGSGQGGDAPIGAPSDAEKAALTAMLSDQANLKYLEDNNGMITRDKLQSNLSSLGDYPGTEQAKAADRYLLDHFNSLATGGTLDPKMLPSQLGLEGAPPEKLDTLLTEASTVQKGEGYWHVAARLLGTKPDDAASQEKIYKLSVLLGKLHGNNDITNKSDLNPGDVIPVAQNLQMLEDNDPDFKAAMQSLQTKVA